MDDSDTGGDRPIPDTESTPPDDYARSVADASHAWYQRAAIRSRQLHRLTETLQLVVSAAIPVTAVILTENTMVPAILGAVVVVVTGLRTQFHWHDNYLRFSQAREAIEAERRLYRTHRDPYDDTRTRDANLVQAITAIERNEMSSWLKISASNRTNPPAA